MSLDQPSLLHIPRVLALEERNHEVGRQREPLLHALLPGPRLPVRFALDEDHAAGGVQTVPAQPDGYAVRLLLQPVVIEPEVDVVEVHAAGHLRVSGDARFGRGHDLLAQLHDVHTLLPLHEEHGEVLGDGLLHAADVLRGDPILPRGSHKVLRPGSPRWPVTLRRARLLGPPRSQLLEEVRHLHHEDGAVVRVDPRLLVQTLHVVAAAHRRGYELIVLLEDLVARGGVEVGELFNLEKLALHVVQGVPQPSDFNHGIGVAVPSARLLGVRQHAVRVGALGPGARPRFRRRRSMRGELG